MAPAVPDWTADRSQLPASRAAVFGETADVGNKRLDWKSQTSFATGGAGLNMAVTKRHFAEVCYERTRLQL